MINSDKMQKIIIAVLVGLVVVLIGLTYYFRDQFQTIKKDPQKITQQETQSLVEKISRLMVVPEGEDPIIATVMDPELLKDQPFFAKAKKGDRVLIYSKARRAILYDPAADKILEVAPINTEGAPDVTLSTP